jgi:hypothetical protein
MGSVPILQVRPGGNGRADSVRCLDQLGLGQLAIGIVGQLVIDEAGKEHHQAA